MAAITAELDADSVKPGEEIQNFGGGPVVVTGVFPMFEERFRSIFDDESTTRAKVHALVDALFDADERMEQGQFYTIKLNL